MIILNGELVFEQKYNFEGMTNSQLIRLSLQKWKLLRDNPKLNLESGAKTCALCQKYLKGFDKACNDCPIFIKTGVVGCKNTPYVDYLINKNWDEAKAIQNCDAMIKLLGELK